MPTQRAAFALGLGLLLAACQGGMAAEPTVEPTATPAPVPPTAPAAAETPAEAPTELPTGEALFKTSLHGLPIAGHACLDCHSLGPLEVYGPSIETIRANAASRIEGVSAEAYVRQSILDPSAHIAGEFAYAMPDGYAEVLTEAQIDSLVAFILSQ